MWLVHYIDQKAFLHARICKLFSTEVEYLSHVVSKHGVATDPKKIDAVKTWLKQSNVSELRSFLGFCGYCRRYIAKFSESEENYDLFLPKTACHSVLKIFGEMHNI
jgi:thiol-disulfide isomerase/thioredoxin